MTNGLMPEGELPEKYSNFIEVGSAYFRIKFHCIWKSGSIMLAWLGFPQMYQLVLTNK